MQEIATAFISDGVIANICATGYPAEILAALPYQCAIVDGVSSVLPTLRKASSEGEVIIDCQAIVSNLIEQKILHAYSPQREQHFRIYVPFSSCLREELADLFTLACVHHAEVALDDPVISKRVKRIFPDISICSTLSILHHWHEVTGLPSSEIQVAFQQVIQHAHFLPSGDDPLLPWWSKFFSDEEVLDTHGH